MNLKKYWESKRRLIDRALDQILPKSTKVPKELHEALRYSVFGNGKRVRPILTLAVAEMLNGRIKDALVPACAIELIHSYSLVHDDLPSMDNDDYRRGKESCHKKYGEGNALLAGDALLTLAFQILSRADQKQVTRLLNVIGSASGTFGMIGGQALDVTNQKEKVSPAQLDQINLLKTGALLKASCVAGAVASNALPNVERRISRFGEYLGFAFQVVDDIIDHDGYLRILPEAKVRNKAEVLIKKAKNELKYFGSKSLILNEIANSLLNRRS